MDVTTWNDLFVAAAGAGAALAGLIIVAMTANIQTILTIPSMTSRAASTIGNLVLVVVVSIVALIPRQSESAFGVEILVFGLAALYLGIRSAVAIMRAKGARSVIDAVLKCSLGIVPAVVIVLAGIFILASSPAGLFLVAAGIVLIFMGSTTNAWVLLVEILR